MDLDFIQELVIETLPSGYRPEGFDCEEEDLTGYLCDGDAERDQLANFSRTYILRHRETGELVAYFSVLCDAIRLAPNERVTDATRYSSAPALKLGRMGVHRSFKKRGIGRFMLLGALGIALDLSERAGVRYLTLDALRRDKLVQWYERFGFVRNSAESKLRALWYKVKSPDDLHQVSMRYDIMLDPPEEAPTN